MKWIRQRREFFTYLLTVMMIVAVATRLYLNHDQGFYTFANIGKISTQGNNEYLRCNCPICHAEDYVATEAEYYDYHPIITTLLCEFGTTPTAPANRIVVTSSLRGPPYLS